MCILSIIFFYLYVETKQSKEVCKKKKKNKNNPAKSFSLKCKFNTNIQKLNTILPICKVLYSSRIQ